MRRVFAFFSRNLSGDTPRLDFAAILKSFRRANFFLDRKKSINMSTPMKGHQISGVICIIRIEISTSSFDIILADAMIVVNSVYLNMRRDDIRKLVKMFPGSIFVGWFF